MITIRGAAVGGYFLLAGMRQAPRSRDPEVVLVRCLLVDDCRTFVDATRGLLDRDGVAIAGTASSISEALSQASELSPDVAVIDIGLGNENGFDLAGDLTRRGIVVVMTSAAAEADYADLLADSPVAGFVPKTELSAARIRRLLGSA
jgi:two-component system, NarL family, nitrate/nitrite response regulator NarL